MLRRRESPSFGFGAKAVIVNSALEQDPGALASTLAENFSETLSQASSNKEIQRIQDGRRCGAS